MRYIAPGILILLFFAACGEVSEKEESQAPNILWIVCEDISPTLSFYGDSIAKTPNLDRLAMSSTIYDRVYTTVGVCAPSRSSIITGMYHWTIGTSHMRTGNDTAGWGRRKYDTLRLAPDGITPVLDLAGNPIRRYSAVIPEDIRCFTEYLRADGYFCTNNQKTDYQFAAPLSAWDENGPKAHWRNRPENTPFFSVFNINDTHESRLWVHENRPITVDSINLPVPPYLPDNAATRHTIARHYSNVEIMDKRVGEILAELEADGLADNTIIFFYSDHGGPLPRQKREIFDSGLKVPMLVSMPGQKRMERTERLISFVDLAPTVLSLAGIQAPDYMQGEAFLGEFEGEEHDVIYAGSDRFDEYTDRSRAIRNGQFLYIRNDYPEKPGYKPVAYRLNIPMMGEFIRELENEELDADEQRWFESKATEELYDSQADPHNMNNLAEDPEYKEILAKMRDDLNQFLDNSGDMGAIPEAELIRGMWPGNVQPVTERPVSEISSGLVNLSSPTPGASISYLVSDDPELKFDRDLEWKLYHRPVSIQSGRYLYAVAERIGYATSEMLIEKID